MKHKDKRKKIIVDMSSQSKYAIMVFAYLMIYSLIVNVLVYLPTVSVLENENLPLESRIAASKEFFFLESRYLPIAVLVMVVMSLHSFRITHRFFGPIYRFKETIKEIAGGNLDIRVRLRKNDYLKDVESVFNGMLDTLSARFRDVFTSNLKCRLIIAEIMQGADKGTISKEQMNEKLQNIKEQLEIVERLTGSSVNNKKE
ncbi:MAG: methyl-accepting chemotaxis protein [Candidatus Schekmanbacteria bacterium]|nr:methyl-accepting chemotaxis protein [Candidatus Schekmanbacteria bacterium]